VEGEKVAMDRGFARKALDGVALMARTAARRSINLMSESALPAVYEELEIYMMAARRKVVDEAQKCGY
jgi:hypothetical protein